ncbi:hypothetical protein [Candidatus Terasakiella magnetica]|nr:hypothetical protein [Candidatus Terasakiella magnetica]
MKPRHVFQRAMDIDHHLTTFLEMHGFQAEYTQEIAIKDYQLEDIVELLYNIENKIEAVTTAVGLQINHSGLKFNPAIRRNLFNLLDRIEIFLLNMGSPSVKPYVVYQKAVMIRQFVEGLCRDNLCDQVEETKIEMLAPKLPLEAYREANKFIVSLKKYMDKNQLKIEGGVTAPKIVPEMITPRIVNRTCSVILADLIALHHHLNGDSVITRPVTDKNISPKHVWHQLNYARRVLEALT